MPVNIKDVYAAGGWEVVVGSGGGSGHFGYVGSGGYGWNPKKQGVRISIVDKNGENVLLKQGLGYAGIDILFVDPWKNAYKGTIPNWGDRRNKFDGKGHNYVTMYWDMSNGKYDSVRDAMIKAAKDNPAQPLQDFANDLQSGKTMPYKSC